jgi:inorganic pyrophosphatase
MIRATYGFILGPRCGDGDPRDVLILVEEPTFPGCRVCVRPIGVLLMLGTRQAIWEDQP